MTLKQWENKPHKTSRQEIANLFAVVRCDLDDAQVGGISPDWRFGIAYNAALKLCTILLYAEGYRPAQNLAHYRAIQAMPLILGVKHKSEADYLDACRVKRNTVEYDYAGGATDADADELIEFVKSLEVFVLNRIRSRSADLL